MKFFSGKGSYKYILAIVAGISAVGAASILGIWLSVVILVVTLLVAIVVFVRSLLTSKEFWPFVLGALTKYESDILPWIPFSKKAASDDPVKAMSALKEATNFVQENPDFCLQTLDYLHKTARPDMNPVIGVRARYQCFRMLTIGIMLRSEPAIIGTIFSTLPDLLTNPFDDVRASATTELGELCGFAKDSTSNISQNWRNLCFDLLDKTITDFINQKRVQDAQRLIRHVSATTQNPKMFVDIFEHIVQAVVDENRDCKADYVEVVCDLLMDTVLYIVQYVSPSVLEILQQCSNLCMHRTYCRGTKKDLRIFEEYNSSPEKNKRVWKRLKKGKEVTSIKLQCESLDGNPCPIGSCEGTDISLKGVNSNSCSAGLNVELRKLNLIVDIYGRKIEFLIPRATIRRPYTDVNGQRIPGAGIEFVEWGGVLERLNELITS